jgi:hypothetical protein
MINYYKTFFILNEEDRGFKEGENPLGYVKIEAREGKGRLNCHVSNLKCQNLKYKLYIMKVDEQNIVPFSLGYINLKGREGELQKHFDPSNVGGTGISIEHFNVAAVLVDSSFEDNIICPLAAYKDKKIEWRNKLKRSFNTGSLLKKENTIIERKDNGVIDNKETSIKDNKKTSIKDNKETSTKDNKEINEKAIKFEKEKNDKDIEVEKNLTEKYEKLIFKNEIKYEGAKLKETEFDIKTEDVRDKDVETKENYFKKLEEQFHQIFKKIKPFRVERKDYRWWQIINPVDLNNIFYRFNIKVPVLFNPLVIMAHFKYKHMMVGLYEDKKKNLRYVVCGIPSLYWVDEKPFGEMCRWAQVEGDKPRYGAFGYWLIYINPATGRILSNN